jgi:hypothetical protein
LSPHQCKSAKVILLHLGFLVKPMLEAPEYSLQVLGRTSSVRQLLLAAFITLHSTLTLRPLGPANEPYLTKTIRCLEHLLASLRQRGWEKLDEPLEALIARLSLSEVSSELNRTSQLKRDAPIPSLIDDYIRAVDPRLYTLRATQDLSLDSWPHPTNILFAVGPNTAIGDEIILIPLARALARRYQDARFEVLSFNATLWDSSHFVSSAHYLVDDVITPYARAKEMLIQNPTSLICFADFHTPLARWQLEQVPGLDRFIFFDIGKGAVHLVDKIKPGVLKFSLRSTPFIYDTLRQLSNRIGLLTDSEELRNSKAHPFLRPHTLSPLKLFLNPFSSKDTSKLEPGWWAEALNFVAATNLLEVQVFSGTNRDTREYASAIAGLLDRKTCHWQLHGIHKVPSIRDTLDVALSCDAILGVDTFTGHLGNLKRIPMVTVFLGSEWERWLVPDPWVLTAAPNHNPEVIGALLLRLFRQPATPVMLLALQLRHCMSSLKQHVFDSTQSGFTEAVKECIETEQRLLDSDPELRKLFTDSPFLPIPSLNEFLLSERHDHPPAAASEKLLLSTCDIWENTNLGRYIHYITELDFGGARVQA